MIYNGTLRSTNTSRINLMAVLMTLDIGETRTAILPHFYAYDPQSLGDIPLYLKGVHST
jgi:hypothetical protein